MCLWHAHHTSAKGKTSWSLHTHMPQRLLPQGEWACPSICTTFKAQSGVEVEDSGTDCVILSSFGFFLAATNCGSYLTFQSWPLTRKFFRWSWAAGFVRPSDNWASDDTQSRGVPWSRRFSTTAKSSKAEYVSLSPKAALAVVPFCTASNTLLASTTKAAGIWLDATCGARRSKGMPNISAHWVRRNMSSCSLARAWISADRLDRVILGSCRLPGDSHVLSGHSTGFCWSSPRCILQ